MSALKRSAPDERAWEREYLLEYVPEGQLGILLDLVKKRRLNKKPKRKYPVQILGKYRISAPTMTFPLFDSVVKGRDERNEESN